ncbi:restriction endonuclease [Ferdinandcohnia sp. SAFN-114]|uniref:restriction endonuclease n=1 Tax=Ferdinandcohnia sp. SAFN-114 TaxID=3387275 RepID=UPI003F7FB992
MKSKIPFYEMEPKEFENLCFDVLTYMNEFKTILRDYRIGTTKYDFTGTYIDTKGLEKKFVVVCKHVDSLSERNLMQILNANTSFDKINVIISGKFSTSNKTIQTTVGKEILLIDGEKISNIILGNQRLIDLYFNPFVKKRKVRKILTFFATLLFAASVYILYINYLSLFGDKQNEKSYTNLDEKISSVENALISIDNLESYLSELRSDMMNTKENKEKIEKRIC